MGLRFVNRQTIVKRLGSVRRRNNETDELGSRVQCEKRMQSGDLLLS